MGSRMFLRFAVWVGLLAGAAVPGMSAPPGEPTVVLALGDSITKGVRGGVTVEETFCAVLAAELKSSGREVTVVNRGIGGERTDQALARLMAELNEHKPDYVLLMYGTNDCHVDQGAKQSRLSLADFRGNLRKLVDRIRAAGCEPILMTEPRYAAKSPANGLGEHGNVRLEQYVAVTREVAAERQTQLVDHFAGWAAAETSGTDLASWTTDGYHPNPVGHRDLAGRILPVVLERLKTDTWLPWWNWRRSPHNVYALPNFPLAGAKVFAQPGALYFVLNQAPAEGRLVLPRLNNVVHRAWWSAMGPREIRTPFVERGAEYGHPFVPPTNWMLPFAQDSSRWTITLSKEMTYPAVVVLDVHGLPVYATEPVVSRTGVDGVIVLSARDAVVHGEKLQFEPLDHKNTVGYWVNPADWAEWKFATEQPGEWEVEIFQGCGTGQGGSDIRLNVAGQPLDLKVQETGHFQNFRWRSAGRVTVAEAGTHALELRCTKLANFAVMDVRQIRLRPAGTAQASPRDLRDVEPDVIVPPISSLPPGPGRRVLMKARGTEYTLPYHVLSLPTDWSKDRKFPVLVELSGNGPYRNAAGDFNSGRVEEGELAAGLGGTDGFIVLSLPYLNDVGTANVTQWWGAPPEYRVQPTLDYWQLAIQQVCHSFGGDREKLVLVGFSRGALATHYVGLHDDQIAPLWRGLVSFSHFDGVKAWPYPGSDRDAALVRLKRLGERSELICSESSGVAGASLQAVRDYLAGTGVTGDFTFLETGFVNHDDAWTLRPSAARTAAREWLRRVLAESPSR